MCLPLKNNRLTKLFIRNKNYQIVQKNKCMEQSPSWEVNSSSATHEISGILWNPKVHYRIHKSPPPVHILSKIDPVKERFLNMRLLKQWCNTTVPKILLWNIIWDCLISTELFFHNAPYSIHTQAPAQQEVRQTVNAKDGVTDDTPLCARTSRQTFLSLGSRLTSPTNQAFS